MSSNMSISSSIEVIEEENDEEQSWEIIEEPKSTKSTTRSIEVEREHSLITFRKI